MAGRVRRPFNPTQSHGSNQGRIRVPAVVSDPVASLKLWPICLTIEGKEWEIPPLPAAEWLSVLMAEKLNLDDILMNLAPDVADVVDNALLNGALSFDEYSDLILSVITMAAGRPWHKALRLIITVQQNWDVVGAELELRGVDADRIALGAWLDIALVTLMKLMEEKDISMFVAKLEAPLPGQEELEMEMAVDDFQALMAGQ